MAGPSDALHAAGLGHLPWPAWPPNIRGRTGWHAPANWRSERLRSEHDDRHPDRYAGRRRRLRNPAVNKATARSAGGPFRRTRQSDRLDEPAQERGQARIAEVIEAGSASDCDAGHVLVYTSHPVFERDSPANRHTRVAVSWCG